VLLHRHQASENSTSDPAAGDDEKDLRLKKALTLLQQRKQLQRDLRSLQQQNISREMLSPAASGKYTSHTQTIL